MMTRKATAQNTDLKLRQTLEELKLIKETCSQLLRERDESETKIKKIIDKNTQLKKELSQLHSQHVEEEEVEEEEDEETMKRKKEEEERRKAEEEEARRKAEELPPPLPPPPPSPQGEPEVPLAPPAIPMEDEVETIEPVNVDRRILLAEDAKFRFKLRQLRKKFTTPLMEARAELTPSQKRLHPSNFKNLPDNTEIIRGTTQGISDEKGLEVLPFAAIMAIVTSYKYTLNTWTPGIVNFVVDTAKKLHSKKKEKFQLAPVHILPKIAIGHQVSEFLRAN
ncbi:hypothetical protein evm_014834 [Chilo suppressalis]|nr:hypothetical protein evm_014834 [Chilo suppressalis]